MKKKLNELDILVENKMPNEMTAKIKGGGLCDYEEVDAADPDRFNFVPKLSKRISSLENKIKEQNRI